MCNCKPEGCSKECVAECLCDRSDDVRQRNRINSLCSRDGQSGPGAKTTGTAHVYHVVILMTMCVYSRILMFNVILKKQTLRIYIKFIAYHSIEILNRTHTENIRIFKSI